MPTHSPSCHQVQTKNTYDHTANTRKLPLPDIRNLKIITSLLQNNHNYIIVWRVSSLNSSVKENKVTGWSTRQKIHRRTDLSSALTGSRTQ